MEEQWAKVPGTSGLLFVSSIGRVWQYNTQRRCWMPPKVPTVKRHGYPTTVHQQKIYRVHYLMAISFLGPQPSPDHSVDHIAKYDGDFERERADNRIENLRWATRKEQRQNQNRSTSRIDKRRSTDDSVPADEEFREVKGVLVSQYGRTRNRYGVAYTPLPNKGMEYALVGTTRLPLHVLVAQAFPKISGLASEGQTTVDHINRNKADNRAHNLRWASMSEQQRNTARQHGSQIIDNLKTAVEVCAPGEDTWKRYASCSDASRDIQVQYSRYIAPQSMAQLIKKHPLGATIRIRQNAGWSFRCPVD
jgi:hypothetical protein